MNQKNGQNSLGLDVCFEDSANPIDLFKKWFAAAEKSETNDPNAFSLGTATSDGRPSVRMVLLKGLRTMVLFFIQILIAEKEMI